MIVSYLSSRGLADWYGDCWLLAGGINVTTAIIAQAVSSDLREKTFRKIQTSLMPILSSSMQSGWNVVRMTNDINQIQNLVMMMFQILLPPRQSYSYWFGCLGHRDCSRTLVIIALLILLVAGPTAMMMGLINKGALSKISNLIRAHERHCQRKSSRVRWYLCAGTI